MVGDGALELRSDRRENKLRAHLDEFRCIHRHVNSPGVTPLVPHAIMRGATLICHIARYAPTANHAIKGMGRVRASDRAQHHHLSDEAL